MKKKIVIIGAGVAGLCTGIYALQNGYEVDIYEKHTISGGMCTGWKRKGYTIDGCIHWLVGSKDGTDMNLMWKEVGAGVSVPMVNHDYFHQIEDEQGAIRLYSDLNKLEAHVGDVAPEDLEAIRGLIKDIRKLAKCRMPMDKAYDLYNLGDIIKTVIAMSPYMGIMKKYDSVNVKHYVDANFRNRRLKKLLMCMVPEDYVMSAVIYTLLDYSRQNAGYPIGGSLKFAQTLEQSYLKLGGQLHLGQGVEKIIVENGRAIGVKLQHSDMNAGIESADDTVSADYVVSAADGYQTLYHLLDGQYMDSSYEKFYTDKKTYRTFTSIQVSLGIDMDLSKESHLFLVMDDQIKNMGGITEDYIRFKNYSYDKTLAPEGKTVVSTLMLSDYNYWKCLAKDRVAYKEEKQRIGDYVISLLEKRIPGISDKIEMIDVATPTTYERYTGAMEGAYMGFLQTAETGRIAMPPTLPGLNNFYMSGMWAMSPAGLPTGLMTGKWTVQRICRQDKKKFALNR